MNVLRIAYASVAAFLAYFVLGGLIFGLIPAFKTEFLKYPAVYRSQPGQMRFMPLGMAGMLVAMVALATLYAMLALDGSGVVDGARFGALIGIFFVGAFVVHNYVNLNIGLRLTLQQAVAYFMEWLVVGVVIGLVYRPVLHS